MSRHISSQRPVAASAPLNWMRLLAVFGGMGLTSGSFAIAKTPALAEIEGPIHTTAEQLLLPTPQAPAPAVRPAAPAVEPITPAFSPLRTSPTVGLSTRHSTQAQEHPASASVGLLAQQMEASGEQSNIEAPAAAPTPEPEAPTRTVPAQISAEPEVPAGYNSVFVDPTNYNVGATKAPSPNLVFSERSTGCQITVKGQTASPQACGGARPAQAAQQVQTAQAGGESDPGIQVGPVRFSERGVSLGNTTIISREAINEKLRPLNILRRGLQQYIFPLAVPAPITSLFGWRVHPIFGDARFHAGTDLGAPMGTPVLATRSGRVNVADYLGGYGLTVILRHDDKIESRYGHLSQILVKPGEWVEQGEVVGLVGSTGNSTGPHLHFEMRQLTDQGWVAVDPQEVLQYGLANLMQIANNPLQAFNIQPTAPDAATATPDSVDLPYRPAQPNAS